MHGLVIEWCSKKKKTKERQSQTNAAILAQVSKSNNSVEPLERTKYKRTDLEKLWQMYEYKVK